MSRTPANPLHYLAGPTRVTITQTQDSSTLVGAIYWTPGADTAKFVQASDGKTAQLNVDQLDWSNGAGLDWPWHTANDRTPKYTGTPVVPA